MTSHPGGIGLPRIYRERENSSSPPKFWTNGRSLCPSRVQQLPNAGRLRDVYFLFLHLVYPYQNQGRYLQRITLRTENETVGVIVVLGSDD